MKRITDILLINGILPSASNYKELFIFRSPSASNKYSISNSIVDVTEAYIAKDTYIYDLTYQPQIIPEFTTKGNINTITTNNGLILIILPDRFVLYDMLLSDNPTFFNNIVPTSELIATKSMYKSSVEYAPLSCYKKIYFVKPVLGIEKYLYQLQILKFTDEYYIFASDFDLSGEVNCLYKYSKDDGAQFIPLDNIEITKYEDYPNTYLYKIPKLPGVYYELWCDKIILPYKPYYNLQCNSTLSQNTTINMNVRNYNTNSIIETFSINNSVKDQTIYIFPIKDMDRLLFTLDDIKDNRLYLAIM